MLLAIDIGNTQTVIGLYGKDKLLHHWRLETKKERTADEWGVFLKELFQFENKTLSEVHGVVISNVVPAMQRAIREMCSKYVGIEPVYVGPKIKIDMPIATDNPSEVGADRIVNAVAAFHRFKTDLIIVDFGTATTFDYISNEGEYQGGLILPGVGISANALFSHAAQLPRIEITKPKNVVGKNTIECMQSGIYYGYVGMVDSVVERIEEEIGQKCKVIATGGFASLMVPDSKRINEVCEFLTLEGLKLIYDWNERQ
ncbi:MAG: pantothenate kinase [Deltaproteobacteria bacterium RIFCSPLOWO2_12_FULL_40_28]|nr:MAG: pantothenate kinase [Deltaproteobacteria bacterium RIFCSPHIGHO2_02_FULL_40_28]OGQ19657.1 MAG: pantothenate kinase [Deltaproteobacteria bacterium RIFCSPHIGHO2_12_FULL_40_32]OGQ40934.1 MAG: pantothenate kinase [Deltaproteobacteria bacterium RIFCSPLOWO2_02_FULL_40_36]OGQ54049.1 MAG: pantothenate kinase [Deltaproteobacteria bacterium RIFCSPLOWO2_12_FULL_40_28]